MSTDSKRQAKLGIAGALLVVPLLLIWWVAAKDAPPRIWQREDCRLVVATPEGNREELVSFYVNTVGMRLVRIPEGSFRMGENGEGGEQSFAKPFYMGATEVTNGLFQRFLRETGYDGAPDCIHDYLRHHTDWNDHASTEPEYPVVSISWVNACKFCEWLTGLEGIPYRLPTEAEWEYACRAGSSTTFYWGDKLGNDCAWHSGNSGKTSQPVGKLLPNRYGLYDMSGNAEEWIHTARSDYPYRRDDGRESDEYVEYRTIRGGAFYYRGNSMRSAERNYDSYNHPYFTFGFRVVAVP